MSQSRKKSVEEALVNNVVGFILGYCTNLVVLPLLGMHPSMGDSVILTIIFAIISFLRSYTIRRWYSRRD